MQENREHIVLTEYLNDDASGNNGQSAQPFNLAGYMNNAIRQMVKSALQASLKNPKESAFFAAYLAHSVGAEKKRAAHEKKGRHIPPFLIASITKSCNLFCKGCYARANNACAEGDEQGLLTALRWNEIFTEAQKLGVAFILLAGGEPLMRSDVLDCAKGHLGILFPVFTNATLIDEAYLRLFDRHRNLVPVLSIEGNRAETDDRRGAGVYDALTQAMQALRGKGIFYGVSITVTAQNVHTVTDDAFIQELAQNGCRVVFYVEYVPVDPLSAALAPGDAERALLEERQRALREQFAELLFLSFPGDEKYTGGCLAAGRGFFHINADGGAEPCPFSPFSDVNLTNASLLQALDSPLFQKLSAEGLLQGEHRGGCTLFEKRETVQGLLKT